ncbi:hypothetical protein MRX96_000740 [Rhipicephalus microplus]
MVGLDANWHAEGAEEKKRQVARVRRRRSLRWASSSWTIVAYVSFMTTVELAAMSQAKRDVTASDGHRGRHPHTKNTPPTPPPHTARSNESQVADA